MKASILVINKFNRYNKENLAEAICNSAKILIHKYKDCLIRILNVYSNYDQPWLMCTDYLVDYHVYLTLMEKVNKQCLLDTPPPPPQ